MSKKNNQTDALAIIKEYIHIPNKNSKIPAILWGEKSDKILIEVHGDLSNKEDTIISIMAEIAVAKGYQVLSFDLPGHGERGDCNYEHFPQTCVSDLRAIYHYTETLGNDASIFASSIGAYFSLLAYNKYNIKHSLFLSPVVNLEYIIKDMMKNFNVTEERLKLEKRIDLPIHNDLYWDYYCYVKDNPICFEWNIPTEILYGSADKMMPWKFIEEFQERYQAEVQVIEKGEHHFHTEDQINIFRKWAEKIL